MHNFRKLTIWIKSMNFENIQNQIIELQKMITVFKNKRE